MNSTAAGRRSRGASTTALIAAVLLLGGACSLTTSFDGLTGGTIDAGAAETGGGSDDGAIDDARLDPDASVAPDSSGPTDASPPPQDAASDASDGATRDGGPDASVPPYEAAVLADHPIAYYRFEETSGTVAVDSSTRKRNGTYAGAVGLGVAGIAGSRAVHVGGGANGVSTGVTDSFSPRLPVTIEAWFAFESTEMYGRVISNEVFGPRQGQDWLFILNGAGDPDFAVERWNAETANSILTIGAWSSRKLTHIVDRFDPPSSRSLYIDGVLAQSTTDLGDVGVTGQTFFVGAVPNSFNRVTGVVDEVAFYDYALPSDRIAKHYALGK